MNLSLPKKWYFIVYLNNMALWHMTLFWYPSWAPSYGLLKIATQYCLGNLGYTLVWDVHRFYSKLVVGMGLSLGFTLSLGVNRVHKLYHSAQFERYQLRFHSTDLHYNFWHQERILFQMQKKLSLPKMRYFIIDLDSMVLYHMTFLQYPSWAPSYDPL